MKNTFYFNDDEYLSYVNDILDHGDFLQMDNYIQHGDTSTMEHCIFVSFYSYKLCKKYNLDYKSAARAGLLHDFFLYDWHTCRKELGINLHGFTHPKVALNNALSRFTLTKKEKDIILKHMWPLTLTPPKHRESFIVMMVDKYCGILEMVTKFRKRYTKQLENV